MNNTLEAIQKTYRNLIITLLVFSIFLSIKVEDKFNAAEQELETLEKFIRTVGRSQPQVAIKKFYESSMNIHGFKNSIVYLLPQGLPKNTVYNEKWALKYSFDGSLQKIQNNIDQIRIDGDFVPQYHLDAELIEETVKSWDPHFDKNKDPIFIEIQEGRNNGYWIGSLRRDLNGGFEESIYKNRYRKFISSKHTKVQLWVFLEMVFNIQQHERNSTYRLPYDLTNLSELNYYWTELDNGNLRIAPAKKRIKELQEKDNSISYQELQIPGPLGPFFFSILLLILIVKMSILLTHLSEITDTSNIDQVIENPWLGFSSIAWIRAVFYFSMISLTAPMFYTVYNRTYLGIFIYAFLGVIVLFIGFGSLCIWKIQKVKQLIPCNLDDI